MKKKGQAAMEFLMTYGWAILVVIAAIAVLAASGLLDFSRILPERCQFPAGMDCVDKPAIDSTTSTVQIALRNNVGWAINVTDIEVADEDGIDLCSGGSETVTYDGATTNLTDDNAVVPHEEAYIVSSDSCDVGDVGDAFDATITVTYINTETGLQRSAVGDVRGRVA